MYHRRPRVERKPRSRFSFGSVIYALARGARHGCPFSSETRAPTSTSNLGGPWIRSRILPPRSHREKKNAISTRVSKIRVSVSAVRLLPLAASSYSIRGRNWLGRGTDWRRGRFLYIHEDLRGDIVPRISICLSEFEDAGFPLISTRRAFQLARDIHVRWRDDHVISSETSPRLSLIRLSANVHARAKLN